MRKTRLVIQPTRCLHTIGFLLLYMSCPVIGDWGLIQPDSAMSHRAISLQREGARTLMKDPPTARLLMKPDGYPTCESRESWIKELGTPRRVTSPSRELEVKKQRFSLERNHLDSYGSRNLRRNSQSPLGQRSDRAARTLDRRQERIVDERSRLDLSSRRLLKETTKTATRSLSERRLVATRLAADQFQRLARNIEKDRRAEQNLNLNDRRVTRQQERRLLLARNTRSVERKTNEKTEDQRISEQINMRISRSGMPRLEVSGERLEMNRVGPISRTNRRLLDREADHTARFNGRVERAERRDVRIRSEQPLERVHTRDARVTDLLKLGESRATRIERRDITRDDTRLERRSTHENRITGHIRERIDNRHNHSYKREALKEQRTTRAERQEAPEERFDGQIYRRNVRQSTQHRLETISNRATRSVDRVEKERMLSSTKQRGTGISRSERQSDQAERLTVRISRSVAQPSESANYQLTRSVIRTEPDQRRATSMERRDARIAHSTIQLERQDSRTSQVTRSMVLAEPGQRRATSMERRDARIAHSKIQVERRDSRTSQVTRSMVLAEPGQRRATSMERRDARIAHSNTPLEHRDSFTSRIVENSQRREENRLTRSSSRRSQNEDRVSRAARQDGVRRRTNVETERAARRDIHNYRSSERSQDRVNEEIRRFTDRMERNERRLSLMEQQGARISRSESQLERREARMLRSNSRLENKNVRNSRSVEHRREKIDSRDSRSDGREDDARVTHRSGDSRINDRAVQSAESSTRYSSLGRVEVRARHQDTNNQVDRSNADRTDRIERRQANSDKKERSLDHRLNSERRHSVKADVQRNDGLVRGSRYIDSPTRSERRETSFKKRVERLTTNARFPKNNERRQERDAADRTIPALEKYSQSRRNLLSLSSADLKPKNWRDENDILAAVEAIKESNRMFDLKKEHGYFKNKPYSQEGVEKLFIDKTDNWSTYKELAGNCFLGAMVFFLTFRNQKTVY